MSYHEPTPETIADLFNSKATIEQIVRKLSDRATARPFPHLRVVGPTPYTGSKKHSIFTNFTQNPPHVVGFKVSFIPRPAPGVEPCARTVFSFALPRHANPAAPDAFEDFRVVIETHFEKKETVFLVESNLRGTLLHTAVSAEVPKEHPELHIFRLEGNADKTFSVEAPVKYRKEDGSENESDVRCELLLEKKIEFRPGFLSAEVKIKNLSRSEGKITDYLQPGDTWAYEDVSEDDDTGVFQRESDYILPGYLLEFDLREELSGAELAPIEGRPSPALRTFNVVPLEWTRERISFADYFIGEEQIFPMRKSGRTLRTFAADLQKKELALDDAILGAVQHVFGKRSLDEAFLWQFQEEAVESISREIKERHGNITIVSVRTAGGKTEGFLIPLLQYCMERLDLSGTKALVFYPTKALANDQAKRLFRMLYYCNQHLRTAGKPAITMALYHGDIETEMTGEVEWIPFKCVRGCEVHLVQDRVGEKNVLRCPACQETFDYCYVTRGDAHLWLPDILITNPDTLTYVMTWKAERHSILGRRVKGCRACGWTTTSLGDRKCKGKRGECGEPLEPVSPQQVPELFVYDEVHLFNGALGMNVAAFNRRLCSILATYARRAGTSLHPVWVASSATIKDADHFASLFFDAPRERVRVVPADPRTAVDTSIVSHSRYNLFLLPRAYRAKQTTSLLVKYLLDISRQRGDAFKPRILGFVNSLRDCNDLILETKSRVNTEVFRVDGHNTQYTREQRSDREVQFNKGELQVLFATSTLEVGIDFEDVHALIIFGPPYHFNDYLQRIGRAGRKTDALVITMCKANQAIDYWYFEHAREILTRPHEWTHRIPIGEENPQVLQKALKLAVFDWMYLREDIAEVVQRDKVLTILFDRVHGTWQASARAHLFAYLGHVFGKDCEKESQEVMENLAKRFIGFQGDFGHSLVEAVHRKLDEEENLDNLRSSERSVSVQYVFAHAT